MGSWACPSVSRLLVYLVYLVSQVNTIKDAPHIHEYQERILLANNAIKKSLEAH